MRPAHCAWLLIACTASLAIAPAPLPAQDRNAELPGPLVTPLARRAAASLQWIVDHQGPDGNWSAVDFPAHGPRHGREGRYVNADDTTDTGREGLDVALTGLSLLAIFQAGHCHSDGTPVARRILLGLRFLRACQDAEGAYDLSGRRDPRFVYGHAVATTAFATGAGMTGSRLLIDSATNGVRFIEHAQSRDADGARTGWGHGVRANEIDSFTTAWMLTALQTARAASIAVDPEAIAGGVAALRALTDEMNGLPKTGYNSPAGSGPQPVREGAAILPLCDAMRINAHLLCAGEDAAVRRQAQRLIADDALPVATNDARTDYHYWHHATGAVIQLGSGEVASAWLPAVRQALVTRMQYTPDEPDHAVHGSWDTTSAWGPWGGRVMTTALNCATLQRCLAIEHALAAGQPLAVVAVAAHGERRGELCVKLVETATGETVIDEWLDVGAWFRRDRRRWTVEAIDRVTWAVTLESGDGDVLTVRPQ